MGCHLRERREHDRRVITYHLDRFLHQIPVRNAGARDDVADFGTAMYIE